MQLQLKRPDRSHTRGAVEPVSCLRVEERGGEGRGGEERGEEKRADRCPMFASWIMRRHEMCNLYLMYYATEDMAWQCGPTPEPLPAACCQTPKHGCLLPETMHLRSVTYSCSATTRATAAATIPRELLLTAAMAAATIPREPLLTAAMAAATTPREPLLTAAMAAATTPHEPLLTAAMAGVSTTG